MDTELNSPSNDGGDTSATFRKPSNDGNSRKYRRRALPDDGSSSSDGSPEGDKSPNLKHSKGDIRRESDSSRYGRGGFESHRHDRNSKDENYRSKRDEYNRNERDAPRSSRDSRSSHHSDRRRVDSEHNRSRNDSDRRSRHSNNGSKRQDESRLKDKEKDYVRGRDCQDEKRGSHWSFGDERKEHQDPEINKRDVHVKSRRDRSDENRDIHSKKLKGFTSEKFTTHGDINAKEKHTSSLNPSRAAQGLTLQSHSKEAVVSGNVDNAKVAAMQAAELVNKNLVGTGYLTTDQKKKLLWGKKKSTATEEPSHRWDSSLIGDRERQEKFNKLMGVKESIANKDQNSNEVVKQKELQMDLEKQYTAGLRRRDGRTVGLGL